MTDRLPTESEFQDWLLHPVTKALHRVLNIWIDGRKEQWAAGQFTDMAQFATAILNAKAIGNCEAFEQVKMLDYSQILAEVDDEERIRT